MKTTPTKETKLYEWHLAYRKGKSILVIYCPQVQQAFAYVSKRLMSKPKEHLQKLLETQALQYHDGSAVGEPLKDFENYLSLAKIQCTYKLEL